MYNTTAGFYFKGPYSPTTFNLSHYLQAQGWHLATSPEQAVFGDANLRFDEGLARSLEYKHLLAAFMARHGLDYLPTTYTLNDHNWRQVLGQLQAEEPRPSQACPWILKPALLNNGQSIYLFQTIQALALHYMSPRRLGGPHVLQRYIDRPLLLRDNRKFSVRQFMILSSTLGAFVYREGYCNVACSPYERSNFHDLRAHLTNEHLSGDRPNVIQIPSARFAFYPKLYSQIKQMLACMVKALKQDHPLVFSAQGPQQLAIFGVDFMLDADQRLWLLEANHGPCFPVDFNHPLQLHLYQNFWQGFVRHFVLPTVSSGQDNTCLGPSTGFEPL